MIETNPANNLSTGKGLLAFFSIVLVISFFIPWVSWDKKTISGADMPLGNFFKASEQNYNLVNPFPALNTLMPVLWLIPALAAITALLSLLNKKGSFVAILAGILALSHITSYILFSDILGDLGAAHALQAGIFTAAIAAIAVIVLSLRKIIKILFWTIIGPLITYVSFYEISKYLENQKFDSTSNITSDYTVTVNDLINEFRANDSLANSKYREKVLTVNGNISSLENPNDSTVNVKFTDSTGSYAIFTFHGQELAKAKQLKAGQYVSVKGSCSGGVLSEILGIEAITFKRCTINNNLTQQNK